MDGTRTARIVALTAGVALVVALTAATLLTSGTRGLDAGRQATASLTERTPVLLRSAEHGTSAAVPRTTPPPTLPEPAPAPARTAAAATAEHP
ncbi:hypothetical protein [Pseudonocardia endophytica]|uniref:Uncharacterized protein n=1 Tax=Pseudonocardia endophytica TaxID=401976 RepID=A0A4R1HX94_PSEEN|nr:hypothetical protein [Pseudonocardia endophytica]TCK26988.1 hypothetical protein EV378_2838 [Pseudonocardia endophytica]